MAHARRHGSGVGRPRKNSFEADRNWKEGEKRERGRAGGGTERGREALAPAPARQPMDEEEHEAADRDAAPEHEGHEPPLRDRSRRKAQIGRPGDRSREAERPGGPREAGASREGGGRHGNASRTPGTLATCAPCESWSARM